MKKIGIIMMFVAAMTLTSCKSLSSAAGDTAAIASGAACGKALMALNSSHKAGTLALTNPNDISNILVVITSYNSLKANKANTTYRNSFARGMVTGGNGLITTANATNIVNTLLNSSGLNGINSSNIATSVNTLSTLITLLNALTTTH